MVDIEAEKKEIERTVQEIFATENQKDLEKILEFYADDAKFRSLIILSSKE